MEEGSDVDDIEYEDLEEEWVRKPTASEILLTPEERQARREFQLRASICCVNEAWRLYRKVTNSDHAIEPANLTTEDKTTDMITRMGVLYDPTAGLRMRYLKKKFERLLTAVTCLKQAAHKPYIRCQRPKKMDIEGQGFALPDVAKNFYPEVYMDYVHPSTFAFKEKWIKIYNSNFVSTDDILREQQHKETSMSQVDLYTTKRVRKKQEPRDLSVEQFDFEDIPLDKEGNPVGKSVGICEWCGKSILPIPSDYSIREAWSIDSLYCCKKYRVFMEEVKKITLLMEAEEAQKHMLIDISARKGPRKAKTDYKYDHGHPKTKLKTMEEKMIELLQEKISEIQEERSSDANVDTYDLPWDPAETRYHNQLRMNAERTATSTLTEIDIVLPLEEVYEYNIGQGPLPGTGGKKSEPETKNAEPETKNAEPETKNAEPETKNAEPETKNAEPEVEKVEPEKEKADTEVFKTKDDKKDVEEMGAKVDDRKVLDDDDDDE